MKTELIGYLKLPFLVGKTKCDNDADAANTWVPACDKAGSYIPGQCNPAIGSCWCVDKLGREIPRTRDVDSKGRPKCDATGSYKDTFKITIELLNTLKLPMQLRWPARGLQVLVVDAINELCGILVDACRKGIIYV